MTKGMGLPPYGTVAQATLWLCVAFAASGVSASPELARQKNCLNCHAVDRKLVGPAFRDIAQRYAGRSDLLPRLADKVVRGGGGAWGPVPMAANPQVTPEQARQLVAWVLTLR